jgi:hypothetical protein
MKKSFFLAAAAFFAATASTGLFAQQTGYPSAGTPKAARQPVAVTEDENFNKRGFVDVAVFGHVSDIGLVGVNLRGGYYFNPGADRIVLDIGVGFDVDPKVTGHFTYRTRYTDGTYGPWRSDGKIEVDHIVVPITAGYEHEWHPSPKWSLRVGPAIGFAVISAEESRNPKVSNATNTLKSDSGAAFLLGVNGGVRWDIIKTDKIALYADLTAGAFYANEVKLKDVYNEKVNLSGARFGLAVGLNF